MENILGFLKQLSENNHREWMQTHKPWYMEIKEEFTSLTEKLLTEIIKFDESIKGLTAKDCMFRINRDIRFSNNKAPYKTNMSAVIMKGGRKSPFPCYYLHIEPGHCKTAGGIYLPAPEPLKKIREEIDYNAAPLVEITKSETFKSKFNGLSGGRLKTAPKGYPRDHPDIEWLRLKSFIVSRSLSDREVCHKDFVKSAIDDFQAMYPLHQYLTVAIS